MPAARQGRDIPHAMRVVSTGFSRSIHAGPCTASKSCPTYLRRASCPTSSTCAWMKMCQGWSLPSPRASGFWAHPSRFPTHGKTLIYLKMQLCVSNCYSTRLTLNVALQSAMEFSNIIPTHTHAHTHSCSYNHTFYTLLPCRHTARFLMAWLFCIPFTLWPYAGWAMVPLSALVS